MIILKAKIIKNWGVQLHKLLFSCFVADKLTSFTCWSATLATNVLNLLCLHKMYSIIIVVIIKSTAIMNMNTSTTKLLVKKFLLGVSRSNSFIPCLCFKSKISFWCLYCEIYSFNVWGAVDKESSNPLLLRNIRRVYSEVVLLVKVGNFRSSVRLN